MSSTSHLGYFGDRRGRATNRFPKAILFGAIALLAFSAGAVLFGETTGIGVIRQQPQRAIAVRDIVITKSAGDVVVVSDAISNAVIATYEADSGGFVRGSLRALDRMRQVAAVSPDAAYRVIQWEDGRVSLSDTATGERFYLDAFGRDNVAAFAAFLNDKGGQQP